MTPGPPDLDERELRAAQAAEAVVLFGAFVFRVPLLVVGVAVIVALGATFGPAANGFHAAYRAVVGPRLAPPSIMVPKMAARALDALAVAGLVLALVGFAIGIDPVAWIFTLAVAAVATVAATTGYNAALALLERLHRDQ